MRAALYSNSLLLVMGTIWLASWLAQGLDGHISYDAQQLDHHEPAKSFLAYLGTSDFWNRTIQN